MTGNSMENAYWFIPAAALSASLLTLISGFGLGTLLLPVFAVFFPLELAILLTAVVHVLNNFFKFGLLGRNVDRGVLLRFGLPGIVGAWLGASMMVGLGSSDPLFAGVRHSVDPLDITIATLMILFGAMELFKGLSTVSFTSRWMIPGGLISGFFGGLSGHQGALRSMFLLRSGLTKEAYIATGVAIAILVDLTRLPTYFSSGVLDEVSSQWPLLTATTLAAFLGAWWGRRLIPKVTMRGVQVLVGILMTAIGVAVAVGAI